MSENRKCVNCRHRILKGSSSYCEVSGNFLHYSTVFEHWCRHWAKDNKLFVCPDQPEEIEAKSTDLENTEIAKSFEQELRKHNQNRYNKWQISKLQVKIDGDWQDLGKVKEITDEWEKYTPNDIIKELQELPYKFMEIDEKSRRWNENVRMFNNGNFGSFDKAETYLNYWKAQAEAGYPLAEENVLYFEEMVRKENGNV